MKSQSFETYANTQIAIYNAMLDFIPRIKAVAQKFDGKVINARFTKALEAASPTTQVHDRTVPVFHCYFNELYDGQRELIITLDYMDGEIYYNQRYMTRFYNLEHYDQNCRIVRIYGKPLDAARLCESLDNVEVIIGANITQLRDQIDGFDEALEKYNAIYEELKKLAHYRTAILKSQEREHEHARKVADLLPI